MVVYGNNGTTQIDILVCQEPLDPVSKMAAAMSVWALEVALGTKAIVSVLVQTESEQVNSSLYISPVRWRARVLTAFAVDSCASFDPLPSAAVSLMINLSRDLAEAFY